MIGVAFIASLLAVAVALLKRGRFVKVVISLALLIGLDFAVTLHLTNHSDPQNPFSGIGPAVIGSVLAIILSLTAFVLSFAKND